MVDNWLFEDRASIDEESHLIVSLDVGHSDNLSIDEAACKIAKIIYFSALRRLPFEGKKDRRKQCPKILTTRETGHIDIAYPLNIAGQREGLSQVITLLSYPSEFNFIESYYVNEVQFPEPVRSMYPGPKYGLNGIRNIFDVQDRPLLGVIFKPRFGTNLDVVANELYKALEGGVDFIAEDDLLVDPNNSRNFETRVRRLANITREAEETTGNKKGYVPTITADLSMARQYGMRAEEVGVDAVAMNGFSMGYAALRDLRENASFDLPIISTNIGVAILTRFNTGSMTSDTTGFSEGVVAKLSRFAGADAVHVGASESSWYQDEAWGRSIVSLQSEFPNMRKSLPVIAVGLNINNIWKNFSDLGTSDFIIEAGEGILDYPAGPKKGAEAFNSILGELSPDMSTREAKAKIKDIATGTHIEEAERYYDGKLFDNDDLDS